MIEKALTIIKKFEGLKLKSYQCSAGKWTIGYGNTYYPNGTRVKANESISIETAETLIRWAVQTVDNAIPKIKLTDNQRAALLSFAYNVGVGGLLGSTLWKKAKLNPNDKSIRDEFMKWDKSNGVKLAGLTRRRREEADLYFSN